MVGRIRTIKPEFFFDPKIGALSPMARLFFIGLWVHADREGRLKADWPQLRALIFPYEPDVNVEELAVELHGKDMVRYYLAVELNGKYPALQIPNFVKHQRPHPKEAQSLIPGWNPDTPELELLARVIPRNAVEFNVYKGREGDLGREGKGREGEATPQKTAAVGADAPPVAAAVVNHYNATNGAKSDDGRPSLLVGERIDTPRKQKPVFLGSRFSVFEWQVRELERTVGDERFDVLGFLFELDSRVGQVIPRDSVWAWLQAQVVGEARRRGMAVVTTRADLSPTSARMMDAIARFVGEEDAAS